jgi:hypothetical protein
MKFCYLDESGMGEEPFLVMAGIIVDAQRMHLSKDVWIDFLSALSKASGRSITEFHSRDFYKGNGPWRNINGEDRATIITTILEWIKVRKHRITFTSLDKGRWKTLSVKERKITDLGTLWRTVAMHAVLSVQKHHQMHEKPKGHTVFVFDNESREEREFTRLICSPPAWTDTYYDRDKKQSALDHVVDVPHFVDSENAALIQVADLLAYILRTYAEIAAGLTKERYKGEGARFEKWASQIVARAIPPATRYLAKGRCEAAQLFWDLAPESLRM